MESIDNNVKTFARLANAKLTRASWGKISVIKTGMTV